MFIDRNAAAVIGDRQASGRSSFFLKRHFDPVGVAGDSLVHRIVEHFSGEVVKRAFIDPADIHSRPAADGFEPLKHLDCGTIIGFTGGRLGQGGEEVIGHRLMRLRRGGIGAQGGGGLIVRLGARYSPNPLGAALTTVLPAARSSTTSNAR